MPKVNIATTARDQKILKFLWRWRYASTSALAIKYFDSASKKRAYNRLNRLKHRGLLVQVHVPAFESSAWCLSGRGFAVIKETLPQLTNTHFLNQQHDHDFLVSAFHLGDWLKGVPEGAQLISEQQLKCIDNKLFPKWVPSIEMHRPDGYTKFESNDGQPEILAIEVEISRKAPSRYVKVRDFYDYYKSVSAVIWVVPNRAAATRIYKQLGCNNTGKHAPHNFLLLKDVLQCGWNAKVNLGRFSGTSYREVLATLLGEKGVKSQWSDTSLEMLNLQICPVKTDSSKVSQKP